MDTLNNNEVEKNIYFTQKELATRWRVSQSTIINHRKEGRIIPFRLPGSTRVLYPLNEILKLERQYTTKEVQITQQKLTDEIKREKPVVSTKPKKEWRV